MRLFTLLILCVITLGLWPLGVIAQTSPSLQLSSSDITVGDSVTVSWTGGSASNRDWIAIYKAGASDRSYGDWEYVTSNTGSHSFTIDEPGTYEFRYLLNNGYTVAATSDTFTVTTSGGGGNADYELSLSVDAVTVGQAMTVSWSADEYSSRDWIAVYKTGASDRSYGDWQYINRASGSFTVRLDEPGTYEFRYLLNNGYTIAATSDTFTVTNAGGGGNADYELSLSQTEIQTGGTITISWDVSDRNSRDWIALYKAGASDRNYSDWKYVNSDTGSLSFRVGEPGTYEFRYLLNNGYTVAATSDTFTVTTSGGGGGNADYELSLNTTELRAGESVRVTWDTNSYQTRDWVALYQRGASNRNYLAWQYTGGPTGSFTTTINTPGTYEFRYLTLGGYDVVATSEPITVTYNPTRVCAYNTDYITNFPADSGPIVAFGDSITYGLGASIGETYVDELRKRTGAEVINAGVPGDTTRDALARLNRDVLSHNPSAVIVFLGGNDEIRRLYEQLADNAAERNYAEQLDRIARNRFGYEWDTVPLIPRTETFSNIETIISRIQATGAVTILVGFDASFYDESIDDEYADIAEDTGSLFVPDIYSGLLGRFWYMSDLVHPNNAGYDIVANRIELAVACVL